MNIVMWILAGGALGWLGCSYFGYNEERGLTVSVIIGSVGGFVGGKLIAPMFGAAEAVPGDFSTSALVFAAAVAIVSLYVGNIVHKRWGV